MRVVGKLACVPLGALVATTILVGSARGDGRQSAHAARLLNATDTAHMHLVRESESGDLIEEGVAKGALPGTVNVEFSLAATIHATFTIHTRDGSISGHGSGELHGSGREASFGGTMTVTRGTGRYAHAHGHGGFYGTINRETHNYAAVVQTTGTLVY
jgi:hypothetical protein